MNALLSGNYHSLLYYIFANLIRITEAYTKRKDKSLPLLSSKVTRLDIWDHSHFPNYHFPLITHLSLGSMYNQPLDNLPNTLYYLQLSYRFHQNIDHLPASLRYLKIEGIYNKPVDHLPAGLTHFIMGNASLFNLPIDYLPPHLTHLTLGDCFNQSVDYLPESLQHLTLDERFAKSIDYLPPNISHLLLFTYQQPICLSYLPKSIKHLMCGYSSINQLPSSITNLTLVYYNEANAVPLDVLPTSIKHLTLDKYSGSELDHLPPHLTHFSLDCRNDVAQHCYFPESTTHLEIRGHCGSHLHDLPPSLVHLRYMRRIATEFVFDHLPESLEYLEIHCNARLDNLPASLKSLVIASKFFQFPLDHLPSSLTYLQLPHNKVSLAHLPESVRHVIIDGEWHTKAADGFSIKMKY